MFVSACITYPNILAVIIISCIEEEAMKPDEITQVVWMKDTGSHR